MAELKEPPHSRVQSTYKAREVEGVLDLAFDDEDAWTIIDFKTRVETERDLAQYRRQVGLYAAAVAKATGRAARGYLIRL